MKTPEVQDIKTVYIAWQNTDLTEGLGGMRPLAVCESESTALRLGKGKDVQGCDCQVGECLAVRIDGRWLAPQFIHGATVEDDKRDKKEAARRVAIEKAKAAGLSEQDLKAILAP